MEECELVLQMAREARGQIVADRRYLHMHPELSFKEYETQAYICHQLDEEGIEHHVIAGTGVIGVIRGEAEGAYSRQGNGEVPAYCLAMRADIDALPVQEETGAEYASANPGVMHACGHDCHIAMLLGAAGILNKLRSRLRGEVRLIFQPAEEITQGARAAISEGALEGVDGIFGMHIWSEIDAHTISCAPGQRMANTDWFRIDVEGRSAHGSMPHKGADAIVVASQLVVALQQLVSRGISPFEPLVLTVGEIHGGTARNIVAGSAYLSGTVRTWTSETRAAMPARIEALASQVAAGLGAKTRLTWEPGHDGLSNDADCAARAEAAVERLFGGQALSAYEGTLAGDDFSEYLQQVPGVFAFLGARNEALDAVYPQHSCRYTIDESVLEDGVAFAVLYALDCLR